MLMSRHSVTVAPSILAADPLRFADEIRSVENAGANWHHIDVMDGHFVPNLTFGVPLVKALKKISKLPLDVHIMVSNPDDVALSYVEAGADILVFHVEVAKHAHRLAEVIRSKGARPGVALNPGTPLEWAFSLAPFIDVIMLMSVNPGFGGQSFIEDTVERVRQLHNWLSKKGLSDKVLIEVDGGMNHQTGARVVEAGARVLVAGTYIYGAQDRAAPIHTLKSLK
jgi:ribulose-phosphate 3-epimerase